MANVTKRFHSFIWNFKFDFIQPDIETTTNIDSQIEIGVRMKYIRITSAVDTNCINIVKKYDAFGLQIHFSPLERSAPQSHSYLRAFAQGLMKRTPYHRAPKENEIITAMKYHNQDIAIKGQPVSKIVSISNKIKVYICKYTKILTGCLIWKNKFK